jgi:hypothetical protein
VDFSTNVKEVKCMLRDAKSEAVFRVVADNPMEHLPFALTFVEILEPLLGELEQDPITGTWNVVPAIGKKTHVKYTRSGSTSAGLITGYEDSDQDDEEHWE